MVSWVLQSPGPQEVFRQLMEAAGVKGTELPAELALINEFLDLLPDHLADALLVEYQGQGFPVFQRNGCFRPQEEA